MLGKKSEYRKCSILLKISIIPLNTIEYQKYWIPNFQYYWIPKILNTEFSILLNTEKNPIPNFNNTENFGIITENTKLLLNRKKINVFFFNFLRFFFYFLLVFSVFFGISWHFSVFFGIYLYWKIFYIYSGPYSSLNSATLSLSSEVMLLITLLYLCLQLRYCTCVKFNFSEKAKEIFDICSMVLTFT